MKAEKQTSKHLLLAVVATVFSTILILIIMLMSWRSEERRVRERV